MVKTKKRAQIALPALYVAFALYGWVDFANTNPDGLANIGLFLTTLPITLAVLLIGSVHGAASMPMPHGHGYLVDHALYYFPAVIGTAVVWWLIGRAIDRAFGPDHSSTH